MGLNKCQNLTFTSAFGSDTQVSGSFFLCVQFQGARHPGDEQASSESEEEEAHLRARGQQTAPVAGGRGGRTKGQMQLPRPREYQKPNAFMRVMINDPQRKPFISMM